MLSPEVKDCITLNTFLFDFKPVDWRAVFAIVSLGGAPGMHTRNLVHFSYAEALKIE